MFPHFDWMYLVMIAPALLLAFWAQARIRSAYAAGMQIRAPMSGAGAARYVLDSAGLQDVAIEEVPGHMTDHYDPRHKVLRLSSDVYRSPSLTAVGIAAHEAGHAIQDARAYAPLVIRNAAVPMANIGSGLSSLVLMVGLGVFFSGMAKLGSFMIVAAIVMFGAFVFFQLINLPVEFNASTRAKQQLEALGIVSADQMVYVRRVLDAAALTYVAATLQAVLTLAYYLMRFGGLVGDRD
ncbi:MAG: zinc metallopeptidase [Pirellulales bacterium]|nr:zinc metallopeptidase [Pirellulales bacterium]